MPFLGHKLWQESWWLCCPESSNVPHTDTAVRKATFSDHQRCCRPWTVMLVFSQREEEKKKRGWKWRDGEIKCYNRKEGNEKRMKEMKTHEWVKGNLSREETGSDCWKIKRQNRKVIIWQVLRSQSDSLTVLRQKKRDARDETWTALTSEG